jgi:glycosyltransferase involved in cell wall biosynthesis
MVPECKLKIFIIMNIVYLNNYYYLRGGSEKVLFDEMNMLKNAGHQVGVYARDHKQNEPAEYADCFPSQMETERLQVSPDALRVVRNIVYSEEARNGIRQLISRFVPDIAHAHNIYGRLSVSVLDALHEAGVPIVMTLHDYKILCPSYRMIIGERICEECKGGRYYRSVVNRCHKESFAASGVYALESWFNHKLRKYDSIRYFISPSRFLRKKCIEFGWDAEKIVYLPNFIDTQTIEAATQPGEYLLYLGRLSREKGVKTLLKALAEIKKDVPLFVVGDGPERADLEKYAAERGLNVRFAGHLGGEALRNSLAKAKAVVMPSEWYENAPLSLLESFAYGKPIIGSRIGGIPEMIDEGVNGFLFEPGNVAELTERIEQLLGMHDDDILAMGLSAREKVAREFSPKRHYAGLVEIYSQAMGRPCA